MTDQAPPSLRETLEAAAGSAAPVVPNEDGNQAQTQATQGVAGGEQGEGTQAETGDAARQRDDKGRFAPKAGDAPAAGDPAAQTQSAPPAGQEPDDQATRVPASIPAALKADFRNLPPAWREAIANLEGSVQTAKAEWGQKGERLNRFDALLAPRQEKFALAGIDEHTALQQLLAASDFLDRDPVNALLWLANDRGVNLAQLVQQTSGGAQPGGQPPAQMHPALQQLQGTVQTLQQQLQQREQADQSARQAEAAAEIDAFRKDPKNIYFADVSKQVGQLLASGQVESLQEAYETAIWANPTIRPHLIKAQSEQAQRDREAADRAKAQAAQRAAGSVTGAPGSATPPATGSKGSVRADIEAARATLGARV
jgi:hypothetical protein